MLHAQQLQTHFSCTQTVAEDNASNAIYTDSGAIDLDGSTIRTFSWDSSVFRDTHGVECSIEASDGLQATVRNVEGKDAWRLILPDALNARVRRGYDFVHGFNCSIRLERNGDTLSLKPSCPVMCGTRPNFSELSVDLKTGVCHYEQ